MAFKVLGEGRKKDVDVTGAQRDNQEGKLRFDLIGVHMLKRVAALLEAGARKYSERNWEKGQRVSRTYASLFRHLMQYYEGDRVEDHLASIVFNAMSIIHVEEEVAAGRLPRELLDFPFYDQLPEFNEGVPTVMNDAEEYVLRYMEYMRDQPDPALVRRNISWQEISINALPYATEDEVNDTMLSLLKRGLIVSYEIDNEREFVLVS